MIDYPKRGHRAPATPRWASETVRSKGAYRHLHTVGTVALGPDAELTVRVVRIDFAHVGTNEITFAPGPVAVEVLRDDADGTRDRPSHISGRGRHRAGRPAAHGREGRRAGGW